MGARRQTSAPARAGRGAVAVVLAAAALAVASPAAPGLAAAESPASGASTPPAATVEAFFRALNHRNWKRACGQIQSGARRFLSGERGCPAGLRSSFHATFEPFTRRAHHWTSGRVVEMGAPVARTASLEVPFRLVETYRCIPLRREHCRRKLDRYVRPERMFLVPDRSGRWRIAKIGAVLWDMELPSPQFTELQLLPPADSATHSRPAQIPPPPFSCAGKRVARVADETADVTGPNYEKIATTPWLDVTSFEIVRTGPAAVCVAIGLAAEPRPDTAYYVFWHRPEGVRGRRILGPNAQTVADLGSIAGWGEPEVEIVVDGEGVPHATVNSVGALTQPFLAPYLPSFGFADGRLEIELGTRQGFPLDQRWAVRPVVNAEPTWSDPLLRHADFGEDRAPDNECVLFPSGRVIQEFFCQGPSG